MTLTVAFECYADEDIVVFLRDHCRLPLRKRHSWGQGEVVNDLLRAARADVGMVDEDPFSSHHALRDKMKLDHTSTDVELRSQSGRHLIVLKPELEECFFRSMQRVGLEVSIAPTAKELQRLLNIPNHPSHRDFREQLQALHTAAKDRSVDTFITDLERFVRKLV